VVVKPVGVAIRTGGGVEEMDKYILFAGAATMGIIGLVLGWESCIAGGLILMWLSLAL